MLTSKLASGWLRRVRRRSSKTAARWYFPPPGGHRFNVPGARGLRTRQTSAETILWMVLRNRGLAGLKFRRQHPIGSLVVDFCCPERRLIVEVDGGVHDDQLEQDAERQSILERAGYRVVRFRNDSVTQNLDAVLDQIQVIAAQTPVVPPAERSRTGGW